MNLTARMLRQLAAWCESQSWQAEGTWRDQLSALLPRLDDAQAELAHLPDSWDASLQTLSRVLSLLHHPDLLHQGQGLELIWVSESQPLWDALMAGARLDGEEGVGHAHFQTSRGLTQALLSNPHYDYTTLRSLTLRPPHPLDFRGMQVLGALETLHIELEEWSAHPPSLDHIERLPVTTLQISGPCDKIVREREWLSALLVRLPAMSALRTLELIVRDAHRQLPTLPLREICAAPELECLRLQNTALDYAGVAGPLPFALNIGVDDVRKLPDVLPPPDHHDRAALTIHAVSVGWQGRGHPVDLTLLHGLAVERLDAGNRELTGLASMAGQSLPLLSNVGKTDLDALGLEPEMLGDPEALSRFLQALAGDERPTLARLIPQAHHWDYSGEPTGGPDTLKPGYRSLARPRWVVAQALDKHLPPETTLRGLEHLPMAVRELTLRAMWYPRSARHSSVLRTCKK